MARQGSRRRHLRNRLFWPAMAILSLVIFITIGVALNAALRADVGPLGILALLLIFAVAMVTALASTEIIPWHELTWLHLRQPKILATFGSVMLVSFGAVFTYIPLLGDEGGVEAATDQLRTMLGQIGEDAHAARAAAERTNADLEPFVPRNTGSLVEQRINGIWGQGDCANTYKFTLIPPGRDGRTLTVNSVKSASGLDPYRGVFAFKAANDSLSRDGFARSILSTEEVVGNHRGSAVDFTLVRSGPVETLIWGSKNEAQNSVELIRCPQDGAR